MYPHKDIFRSNCIYSESPLYGQKSQRITFVLLYHYIPSLPTPYEFLTLPLKLETFALFLKE